VTVVVGLLVGAVTIRFLCVAGRSILSAPALERVNYRNRAIPTAGGILIVVALLIVEAGRAVLGAIGVGDDPGLTLARSEVLFAVFGFGFLGLIDDVLGSGHDRGFRGHLRALSEGRLTTGFVKLLGGAGVAVLLVATPGFATGRRLIVDALLIALAANLGNLLDLAPGRTIKGAAVVYVPLAIAVGTDPVGIAMAPVMGAAFGLLPDDLGERLMIGDTGAMVIGAVLGVGVVLGTSSTTRTVVLLALIALNVLAEVASFSRFIDRVGPLRAFDRLGRRRDKRPPRRSGR
jgi:UDP-N-acetylmuramyl pentapeptide phosphotransferase/UDP-N-acetylglucosamine-1-phosphate transferase